VQGSSQVLGQLSAQVFVEEGPIPEGATLQQRLEARLSAIVAAAEQVADEMDDDGKFAVVLSERLQRLLGFARRDKRDIEDGTV
jgi:hypothetical protein